MTRMANPLLLGFEAIEKTLDRAAKSAGGYPPYNIERIRGESGERLRITLAVAGFSDQDLDITVDENQLVITGKQAETGAREYLYRGIASRQFQLSFVLADGMRVISANLRNGLLSIELDRPQPQRRARRIEINVSD